jgi:uncharacterized MAPEG superfamily protein
MGMFFQILFCVVVGIILLYSICECVATGKSYDRAVSNPRASDGYRTRTKQSYTGRLVVTMVLAMTLIVMCVADAKTACLIGALVLFYGILDIWSQTARK